jgi:hypothetical protein
VNALINVVPDVVNVLLLCLLFFIMFGVIFVQNLKGKFYMCQGSVFDETIAGTVKEEFLTYPKSWNKMTEQERYWFNGNLDDDGGPQCSVWSVSNDESPTSKMVRIYMYNVCMYVYVFECLCIPSYLLPPPYTHLIFNLIGLICLYLFIIKVCKCLGAKWSTMIAQNFDNINNVNRYVHNNAHTHTLLILCTCSNKHQWYATCFSSVSDYLSIYLFVYVYLQKHRRCGPYMS